MFEFESCREWNVCVCCVVYSGWERVCDLAPARSINTYHDAATATHTPDRDRTLLACSHFIMLRYSSAALGATAASKSSALPPLPPPNCSGGIASSALNASSGV